MTSKAPVRIDENEIRLVAKGLVEGRIFTFMDCEPDMIGSVFMPVGLGCLSEYDFDQIGCVFEWMDKAGERGINGYPMFLSCRVAHVDDWTQIVERAQKIATAVQEAMK